VLGGQDILLHTNVVGGSSNPHPHVLDYFGRDISLVEGVAVDDEQAPSL